MIPGNAGAARAHLSPDLRLGLATWSAFIVATCLYCLVHQAFVSAVTPDVARTLVIALREWGAWALLAPLALRVFRQRGPLREWVVRSGLLALLAASLPVLADLVTGDRTLGASLALFWPRNLAMAAALTVIARAFARPSVTASVETVAAVAEPASAPAMEKPLTLLVSKGGDQCLIRIEDIQHLSAAGNYVDICAANQRYLLRITMGDLEALLSPRDFVRIHRSHIVRVREIERIRIDRSGSGTVHLRGGASLAISKGYRAQLKSRQDALKPSIH